MLWGKYHNDLTIPSYELLVVKTFPSCNAAKICTLLWSTEQSWLHIGAVAGYSSPHVWHNFLFPIQKTLNEWKSVTIMVSCTTSDSTLLAGMYTHYICSVRDLTLMKHHWKRSSFFKCEIYYFENETIIKILRLLFFVTTLYEVVFIIFMSVNAFTAQFDSNKVGSSFFCKVCNAE